jgi:FkbM family methyltransferase
MNLKSLCEKVRVAGFWFKYFENPLLIFLTRLGWIQVVHCSLKIRKEQNSYTMLVRPVSNAGGDLWVCREVLIQETYKSILKLLPSRPLRVVDVGANIGAFTIWLHHQRGIKEGYCFEPDLDSFRVCQFNLNQNGCDGVHISDHAIGGTTREAEIWIDSAQPARSSICRKSPTAQTQKIQILSLNDWLNKVEGDFDLLKLDCEGSEWEILEAGQKCFSRFRIVVVEVHRDFTGKHEIGDFAMALSKHGFTTLRWDGTVNGLWVGQRDSTTGVTTNG